MAILDVPKSNLILMNLAVLTSKSSVAKNTPLNKRSESGEMSNPATLCPLLFAAAIVTNISYRKIPHPCAGAVKKFKLFFHHLSLG